MLVENPGVDKIAFTGSTEVGRLIRQSTAGSGKSLTLELGGKSPFIVFDDADIDGAVEGVVDAIWFNQGQVCCAGSRLLLQEGIADTFRRRLIRRMETLRVGTPLDKAIDMGAIVAPVQLERIKSLVETGVREGAEKYQAARRDAGGGLLLSADPALERASVLDRGDRGDLRPGAGGDDVPHARRGRDARQQHTLWACRQRVERDDRAGAGHRAEVAGGRGLGQLDQSVRRQRRLRRLSRVRFRPRGRPRRHV